MRARFCSWRQQISSCKNIAIMSRTRQRIDLTHCVVRLQGCSHCLQVAARSDSMPASIVKLKVALEWLSVLLLIGVSVSVPAAENPQVKGTSPALCGSDDTREPGIQGDVPAGQTANYNCGLKLVGQPARVGNVQGTGKCAYVRSGGNVFVVDVSDPAKPVEVGTVPVKSGSETMRVVVTDKRAVLVSGSSVYDIADCLHPVLAGEIAWPPLSLPGVPVRLLPHDIRINHAGTKVYASFGLWEADISNLHDPKTWSVTDHR